MRFHVSIEWSDGVDGEDVEAPDMDGALMEGMDALGQPLSGVESGHATIRIVAA